MPHFGALSRPVIFGLAAGQMATLNYSSTFGSAGDRLVGFYYDWILGGANIGSASLWTVDPANSTKWVQMIDSNGHNLFPLDNGLIKNWQQFAPMGRAATQNIGAFGSQPLNQGAQYQGITIPGPCRIEWAINGDVSTSRLNMWAVLGV